jgi:hypothetical protein
LRLQHRIDAVCVPEADILIMLHAAVLETMTIDVDVGVDEIVPVNAEFKLCGEDDPGVGDLIALEDDREIVRDTMLDMVVLTDGAVEDGCGAADDLQVLAANTGDRDDDDDDDNDKLGLSKPPGDIVSQETVEESCDGKFGVLAVTKDA